MLNASVLVEAVNWVRDVLLGTVGTAVGVLAVAAVGLLMLSGVMPIKRGAIVVAGCFVLFSAGTIADALIAGTAVPSRFVEEGAPATPHAYTPSLPTNAPYDPYAGASVPSPEARRGAEAPSR